MEQDVRKLDVTQLHPLSPEVISRQATINIGKHANLFIITVLNCFLRCFVKSLRTILYPDLEYYCYWFDIFCTHVLSLEDYTSIHVKTW